MSEFAGALSERITIERPVTSRTPAGLQEAGWETLLSCFAAISAEGAGPEAEAMALSAMPRFRVVIRQREGIAVDQRVRWGARVMMIRQYLYDPRARDRLTLRCEEVRA
jgi:head-tail adaptor